MAIGFFIVDEHVLISDELKKQIEEYKTNIENEMVYLVSQLQLLELDFTHLENHVLAFGYSNRSSFLAQAMLAAMPEQCEWDFPAGYGDWRDFIPNPTRPKQKGRAYKTPKQSFRAQMRSVNRNR